MKAGKKEVGRRIKISPSVLSADFCNLAEQVRLVERAGADSIHIDVMDGRFVPNITIGPVVVEHIRASTRLPLDVHLMIVEPEKYIEAFARAGADLIYVHQETCAHLHMAAWRIRELGLRAAAAVNPSTPAAAIEEVLGDIDRVLVMTVNPGFGGQRFIDTMLPKIGKVRRLIDSGPYDIELEVDGGINNHTAPKAVKAGATRLVAGNAVFKARSIEKAIRDLRKAASRE